MARATIERYKSFEKWKTQEVETEFLLQRANAKVIFLTDLINNPIPLSVEEKNVADVLQEQLRMMVEGWNEYDMSILFIGPILTS